MVDRLFNYPPIPSSKVVGKKANRETQRSQIQRNDEKDFSKILSEKLQEKTQIKFSSHAMERIRKRNIVITGEDMKNIENALKEAEKKGAKEALLVGNRFSLIVSVKNKTIITAIDEESMRNNIFTNIDSAVIL